MKQIYNEQIGDLLDPTQRNLEACICHPFVLRYVIKLFTKCIGFPLLHAYYGWFKLLQMKDDSKNALYIENLTEEYVTSYDDVIQILIKVGTREVSEQLYC